jgi:hypothetical protein
MRQASAAHRLLNLVQSALLPGGVAAVAWAVLTTVVTADLALLLALAMIAGLALGAGAPKRFLLPGRRIPEPSKLRTHPPTEVRIRRLRSPASRPAAFLAERDHRFAGFSPAPHAPPRFQRFETHG